MMTDRPDRAGSMDREAVAFGSSTLILPDTFLCSLCRQLDDKNGAVDEIGTWRMESCWHLDLAKNHDLDASAFNNNHHSSTLINQGASCIMHRPSSIPEIAIQLRHSASPFSFSSPHRGGTHRLTVAIQADRQNFADSRTRRSITLQTCHYFVFDPTNYVRTPRCS